MRSFKFILILSWLYTLQSCLFGAGLVEFPITDNIYLFGNGSYEKSALYYSNDNDNCSAIIVPATVFAVGYDENFIIAKSRPIDWGQSNIKTYYHIININTLNCQNKDDIAYYTLEQFVRLRKNLNLPRDLDFSINFENILNNVKKTVN